MSLLYEEFCENRAIARKAAKNTLQKGDWCAYGGPVGIWGFGRIHRVEPGGSTCEIQKREDQTSYHNCSWEINPYVFKYPSLREAAEAYYYYQCHCTDHRMGGPSSRSDFEFNLSHRWPSFYVPLEANQ